MAHPSGIFNETYSQDMSILRTRRDWILLVFFFILLFTLPLYGGDRLVTLSTIIGISLVSVLGLNILTGLCGQISLGQAGFMAIGGYVSAVLSAKLGWPFWAALPVSALSAGVGGLVFGLPSLKIKGFYLIMATIAAHFIIIWIIIHLPNITGGPNGIAVPRPKIGSFVFQKTSYFYLVMVAAILATIFAKNIARSRIGRAFIAIRDNDLAAEVMGINLWRYKLLAFFTGCVYAGAAGSLMVHYVAFATTEQFQFTDSVWYLGMLIVGGMGSTTGAIFGVLALKLLDELVTIIGPVLAMVTAPQAGASLSLIVRGMVIILFLIFEPQGLAHRWELVKNYFEQWPFSHHAKEAAK